MSSRRTISNTFTVTTMDDPVSVQAQYSPDKTVVHTVWQAGDLYMRTRESDSSAWSSWHKIVGESGDETDFSFGISQYKTTANVTTAPSDITTWSDAPLAVTSSKPYLWAKVQKKSWNESTQQYQVDSTSYIRLTGEDGEQGEQGKIGRFYYYAQEWVDSSNVSYSVTDTEAPFFAYNNNYWVFNPTANGSYSMHDMGAPSSSSVNWKLMVTDFKFIIAQAIFSNYAHLGSFIVNGDWLLAQYGKVNNVASANYQAFDPLFPKTAYLCQGVACDVNYQNINKHTFTAGKTYNITLIGENFYRDSGITAQMILNVRMYNGSSNVGSTINLTPSNPTQVLEFTPPSTGDYYLRVDMQSGGTHGTLTAFVNNVFIPNYAVDGLSGKTYQKEGYFGGVIESEDTEQGNKIVLDVANGGFKMIGPRSIRDDDHKPSGNSRETLAEINFAHDPDTLTRLAYMDLRDGHDNHVIELDPFYGVHISDNVLGDDHSGAGLGTDGFSCHSGEGSNFKSVVINEYGVTIFTGSSSTSKTWEEIFNNN